MEEISQDEREEERRKIMKEMKREKHASYSSHDSCKSLSEKHSDYYEGRHRSCHTLISSGDDHLPTFGFLPGELSCLTQIAAHSIRFWTFRKEMCKILKRRAKGSLLGHFSAPEPPR